MNVRELLAEHYDEDILLADGFDKALIGIGRIFYGAPIAVYDRSVAIDILRKQGMKTFEAEEYFSYNVSGAYVGEGTPMFVETIKELRRK
jgi:hypothetical protein